MNRFNQAHNKFRYFQFHPTLSSPALKGIPHFSLKLPQSIGYESQKVRILLVLGHIPTEDLRNKEVFRNTETGHVLSSMLMYGKKYARRVSEVMKIPMREEFGLAAIDFNFVKFYHLSQPQQQAARQLCAKRVRAFIKENKPTHVIFLGHEQEDAVLGVKNSWYYQGIVREGKIGNVDFKYTNILDFGKIFGKNTSDKEGEFEAVQVVGHIARQLAHVCYLGKNPFTCADLKVKPVYINTIHRFKLLMRKLRRAKEIAVDTETTSLSRCSPTILTIQFADSSRCGYVVPIEHKDTPFNKKQLDYIKREIRKFFLEKREGFKGFLGHNFKYDLTVIRKYFGIPIIDANIWCTMGAEFALDENTRFIDAVRGKDKTHFPLGNLLAFYGNDFYQRAKFSKDDRATIVTADLTKDVLNYTAMDVQGLHEIKRLQILRAQCEEFEGGDYRRAYERLVWNQVSAIVQIMSHMEQTGIMLDVKYTMELASQGGPLRGKLNEAVKKLYAMKSVHKANRMLSKDKGGAQKGLFGQIEYNLFDLGKPAHKQLLFIDILDLEPTRVSKKTGLPSVDKGFQAKHKEVPEVARFIDISTLQTLLRNFVEKFLKIVAKSEDGKKTRRIFPSFGYTKVVTGRGNSYNPNFMQIPSRGDKASLIKRMFIAPPGKVIIKLDLSTHEVRCWSIISFDKVLASVFKIGRDLRKRFYKEGGEDLRKQIELKGDVHKLNYNFFFKVPIPEITKDQRNSVKNTAFGVQYGMGDRALAAVTKLSEKEAVKLKKRFFGRFPKASDWIDRMHKSAREKFFAYSLTGRRRNLFGYFFDNRGIRGSTDRMAANAPTQGLGADAAHFGAWLMMRVAALVLQHFNKVDDTTQELPIAVRCMVHDSVFLEVAYEHVWLALHLVHHCMTVGVAREFKRIYGAEFTVPPEIDLEIGKNEKDLYKWDWSPESLKECITKASKDAGEADGIEASKIRKLMLSGKHDTKLTKFLEKNYPVFVDA